MKKIVFILLVFLLVTEFVMAGNSDEFITRFCIPLSSDKKIIDSIYGNKKYTNFVYINLSSHFYLQDEKQKILKSFTKFQLSEILTVKSQQSSIVMIVFKTIKDDPLKQGNIFSLDCQILKAEELSNEDKKYCQNTFSHNKHNKKYFNSSSGYCEIKGIVDLDEYEIIN